MAFYASTQDFELRDRSLGQASSIIITPPATQVIATGGPTVLENAFPSLQLLWPTIPVGAQIQPGTTHANSVVRVFDSFEGVTDVEFTLQFQDQTLGNAVWTIQAINGLDLDTGSEVVLTTLTVGASSASQNSFVNARFRNRAAISTFPGVDGDRRYIDAAIRLAHDQPGSRTIQLVSCVAVIYRASYR